MSLRTRLTAALALLAALATVAVGLWSYRATASRLDGEVDRSLADAIHTVQDRYAHPGVEPNLAFGGRRPGNGPAPDEAQLPSYELVLVQVLRPDGTPGVLPASVDLPVDAADERLAASSDPALRRTREVTIDDVTYRLVTAPLPNHAGAVQVARSLEENDRVLGSLRDRTALAVVGVVALAAALGWIVATGVTRRLVRLTETAEAVAATGSLDVAVPASGRDEAGRLGAAFEEMLAALARSKEDQQRLVQDAGHELRTPLTSLRTNVAVLRRFEELPPDERARLLADLDGETRELTDLVNELVELATERRGDEPAEPVDLGALAERVAARARRRTGRVVVVDADGTVVEARPQAVERAIANLVDNAAKFDVDGTAPIEVVTRSGRVEVRDRGPGIPPEDLPHVFDRFYRSTSARSRPGSGLGLAIVQAVAEAHGGTVFAEAREGGGAVIGFTLPLA